MECSFKVTWRRPSPAKKSWASETTSTSRSASAGPSASTPELVVLAVAAVLGVLVAERGRHVPGLPRRHGVVLHVGPGDGGGPLGAQRHHLAVAVLEDVHLLADDLAALADATQEHAGVLEDGRDGQPVAGTLDQRGEAGDRPLPAGRLGPQHVVHALRGTGGTGRRPGPGADEPALIEGSSRLGGQTFLPGS